jgi:surfactin synthase thioesterase subunit
VTPAQPDSDKWIRRYHPSPQAATRLVCFPHAGGSASYYHALSQALAPDVEVLAVQYPGRQDRYGEPALASIAELTERLVPLLRPWAADRPLAFFGHSMGAVLAFEVARRLPPQVLFASGRRAPSRVREETVHLRDDDGLVAEILALSGTDSRVLDDQELLRMVLPAIRADYTAIETYRMVPGPLLDCPIEVLLGVDDPKVTEDEALAWAQHTTAPTGWRPFPGGHFYLADQWDAVASVVARALSVPTRG